MTSKRADIVAAARDLLWQVGYEAMSPRKVLAASGAGQGSLYHHFGGKKELGAAVLETIAAEMRTDFDALVAGADEDPLAAVDRYLGRVRDGLKGCRLGRLAHESAFADPALRAPLAGYFRHVESTLADCLWTAVRQGRLAGSTDVRALAAALVATVQGGYVLSRATGDGEQIGRATDGARALLREAMRAEAATAVPG